MSKKQLVSLEDLSKEELLQKCKNQRYVIARLNEIANILRKKCELYELVMSRRPLDQKIRVCINETLSYMEEIEEIKKEKINEIKEKD